MPLNFRRSHLDLNKVALTRNKENLCVIEHATNDEPLALLKRVGPVASVIRTKASIPRTKTSVFQAEAPTPPSIEIYMSYVPRDKRMQERLAMQLRTRKYSDLSIHWTDGEIGAGEEIEQEIKNRLKIADVILVFLTVDYLDSLQKTNIEMEEAVKRHKSGKARVIPILLGPCPWRDTHFVRLQILPKNAKPLSSLSSPKREEAFSEIADEIRKAILKWVEGN